MKALYLFFLSAWALFAFSSCSDMIQSLRQESEAVDRESDREEQDEIYAGRPRVLRGLSANNTKSYDPEVKRFYGRKLGNSLDAGPGDPSAMPAFSGNNGKRYTRNDFRDANANENSLWDGQGQGNYLFSQNRRQELGDVVTVDVEKELRRELQYQLWMTLPAEQRKIKRNPASVGKDEVKNVASAAEGAAPAVAGAGDAAAKAVKSAEERARDAAEEAAKSNLASVNGKEDDVVRMEVVENMGNGMVRMVGQKRVVYKGVARVLEVSSIANSRDIDDNGHLKSSAFLDTQTQVIQ